jgi:hypothetical protein
VETLVDEEIEWQIQFVDERLMAGGVGRVDSVGFGVRGSEGVNRIAHGGELVRSAGGAVGGVEKEGGALFAAQLSQVESRSSRARE